MKNFHKQSVVGIVVITLLTVILTSSNIAVHNIKQPNFFFKVNDTIDDDSLKFPFEDYNNTPNPYKTNSPLFLKNPSNIKTTVEYDPKTGKFIFKDKIGDFNYRNPQQMSFEEYMDYQNKKSLNNYWQERSFAEAAKGESRSALDRLIDPRLVIHNATFDKIFGSNKITVKPQGNAELVFGVNISKVENPTLPKNLQRNITFEFDEHIKMGLNGKIGEKLTLGINYDSEATFEFEDKKKLTYEGEEDEIIQKIELGNVSLPLSGSLITGSHSLFGIKTELKFGKVTITSVASQQKGEKKTIEVKGGAMTTPFEITADNYESGKHFFMAQYFRDHYDEALKGLPIIRSNVNITKVEVWVTNRSSRFENSRNIVAFTDLGESREHMISDFAPSGSVYPDNEINSLYNEMNTNYSGIRDINSASAVLSGIANFNSGEDYEKIQNARLLSQSEYSFHPNLGYISLNSGLNNDEVLAIAFEYTAGGQTYRVGEFSNETPAAPQSLILKLLKPTMLSTENPTWDLMMKNIYAMNAYQVNSEDFRMDVMYRNDKTGSAVNYIPAGNIDGEILLDVMGLDKLNKKNEQGKDGFFDFVDRVTINATNGRIIFPVVEPFGEHLRKKIVGNSTDPELNRIAEQYVFQELYTQTQSRAAQNAEKNKFFLQGEYRSAGGSEINLNAMNIPEGSVKVTAGGRELVENTEYTVDYNLGRVTIINQGLLESGTPISISLESNMGFDPGTKTFFGSHADYKFSDDFNIGTTILHLRQNPPTKKISIGNEPIANTIWGLDMNFTQEAPILTKIVDWLPFIETKEKSSFDFTGEAAQLIPGHPKIIGDGGFAHIDDFEASKTTLDLKHPTAWRLASVPQKQTMFPEADSTTSNVAGYNRAKIAWYSVNRDLIYGSAAPDNITVDDQSDHRVRIIPEKELFPNKDTEYNQPAILSVLNLAYYPKEKGPYNYDSAPTALSAGVDENGDLNNPSSRWGGIMRDLITNDFEEANIEFVEFWMLDPFVYNENHEGGNLYFDFGNISEDILRDSRQSFENGLPTSAVKENIDSTQWGYVPLLPRITDGFANEPTNARQFQDVGLDGLSDNDEKRYLQNYLDRIKALYGENSVAYQKALSDPSSDDYLFFKDPVYDTEQASILERYKKFNNHEGNSTIAEGGTTQTTGQSRPDMEDINGDYTLSETEAYFQYKVHLQPGSMNVGENYITDIKESTVTLKNKNTETVKWYHFKIPLSDYDKRVGAIQDFKSIRFTRMFMRGWKEEVVLRFAELYLVRGEWRKYKSSLLEGNEGIGGQISDAQFDISAVNIEENASRQPVNYILPPGVDREISVASTNQQELNEQSIVLKAFNLADGDARAAYKNASLDVRQFKRLQMFIHAEAVGDEILNDNDVCAFVRIGSDYKENYYEYEIPLKLTEPGVYNNDVEADREAVWNPENMLDIDFEIFQALKHKRNVKMRASAEEIQTAFAYSELDGDKRITVVGNPNLSNIRTIMIGLRNRSKDSNHLPDDGLDKTIEVWMNEFRLSGFNEQGGWAVQARMSAQLADFSTIALAGNYSTPGFGSLEKRVSERQQSHDYGYDFSSNFELGKFFPQKYGVKIPLYVGYSETFSDPQYNPHDPDILLRTSLSDPNMTQAEKDSILHSSQDYIKRRSINITNLNIKGNSERKKDKAGKKNKRGKRGKPGKRGRSANKKKFYSISNWTASYGFNETYIRNINIKHNILREHTGGIAYNFNNSPRNVAPFKKVKFLRKKPFRLIKDFNFYYMPSLISIRNDMRKTYNEIQLRNIDNDIYLPPTFDKQFTWNRTYDVKYDLSKALKLTYSANNSAWVDEPVGRLDKEDENYKLRQDTMWNSIRNLGRTSDFHQKIQATWNIPINKLPFLDWTSANARYAADYYWTRGVVMNDPETEDTLDLGNNIRNTQNIQLSSQLNITKLYRKVKYLKKVDKKFKQRSNKSKKKYKKVEFKQEGVKFRKKKAKTIIHNLKIAKGTKITVTDAKGKKVNGTLKVISPNKLKFTANRKVKNAKVVITGKSEIKENVFKIIADYTLYSMMSLRNISATYTENNGTVVPGYMPKTQFFGADENWNAPGWKFILGYQNPLFGKFASDSEWLSGDSLVNSPVLMTSDRSYNLKATLKPFKGLRVDLTADYRTNNTNSEFWVKQNGEYISQNQQYEGNFSMSFLSIKTAFGNMKDSTFESEVYNQFLSNRQTIASRLASQRDGINGYDASPIVDPETGEITYDGYSNTSQEVLLPAFLAAYSNQSASSVLTSPFPQFPLPNWRVKYDGLTYFEPVKKVFKKVIVNHGYRSNYNVSSFASNPNFDMNGKNEDGFSFVKNELDQLFIPEFQIGGVVIDEKFIPLLGIDLSWKNDLSTKLEYKQARNLALSFSNNQLLEMQSKEYTFGVGYKYPKLKLPITVMGSNKLLESDLNVRFDFTYRDMYTIIRRIQELDNRISAGQKNISLKLNLDYDINNAVTLRMFYDHTINAPHVSTSYKTSNIKVGFSLRFNLLKGNR